MSPGRRRGRPSRRREVGGEERPRARLLRHGAESLSDAEVLAVLLMNGCAGRSAVEQAREILAESGGLLGLAEGRAWLACRGIGDAKAARLLAAVEISCRLAREKVPERQVLNAPSILARYLLLRYVVDDQEIVGALYLDVRGRVIAERVLYRGTLRRASVEPRAILKEALLRNAAGFVLFHTHPSGDPSPSAHDLDFTRQVKQAAEVMGVDFHDHLILARGGRWLSLRRHGPW